jgi:hypothetical protein
MEVLLDLSVRAFRVHGKVAGEVAVDVARPERRPFVRRTGLNQMTVSRFERLIGASPFKFESFEAVPIRKLRWAASRMLREFTTSIVRCRLVPRDRN